MFKIYLLSMTVFFVTICSSQIVTIPDANFKAYLVGNTSINTGGDPNEIEVTEAEAYTGSISCSNQSISDFSGLESFINITAFNCYGNPITSLDVSSNTALTYINVGNTGLSSLDFSPNTALKRVFAYSMNALTSLNMANGNNANMTKFYAIANSNLTCVQIDSGFTPTQTAGWDVSSGTSYSDNCNLGVDIFNKYSGVKMFPNPAINTLNITTEMAAKSINVYSLLGKKVVKTHSKQINISSLSKGVYVVVVELENGQLIKKHFVKK